MRLMIIGFLAFLAGSGARLEAQSHPGLRPLEVPQGMAVMCRAVSAEQSGLSGQALLAREFGFFEPDTVMGVGTSPQGTMSVGPRQILAVFDSAGVLYFLTDEYIDSKGGGGWSVVRDSSMSFVGARISVSLADVLKGEVAEPSPSSGLSAGDSARVESLARWLWDRRCDGSDLW